MVDRSLGIKQPMDDRLAPTGPYGKAQPMRLRGHTILVEADPALSARAHERDALVPHAIMARDTIRRSVLSLATHKQPLRTTRPQEQG